MTDHEIYTARMAAKHAWDDGEIVVPESLLKPQCDRCTESFEPSQLRLFYRLSVCPKCAWALAEEAEQDRQEERGYAAMVRRAL